MAGGGHHYSPAQEAFFAARRAKSEEALTYYAAGLAGLIAVFVLFHWTRWLCVKLETSKKPLGILGRPFVAASRYVTKPLDENKINRHAYRLSWSRLTRNLLVRRVAGFNSAGHALLVTAYVGLNFMAMFINVQSTSISNYASRFGWYVVNVSPNLDSSKYSSKS
jgi:hypothetical protein